MRADRVLVGSLMHLELRDLGRDLLEILNDFFSQQLVIRGRDVEPVAGGRRVRDCGLFGRMVWREGWEILGLVFVVHSPDIIEEVAGATKAVADRYFECRETKKAVADGFCKLPDSTKAVTNRFHDLSAHVKADGDRFHDLSECAKAVADRFPELPESTKAVANGFRDLWNFSKAVVHRF